MDQNGIQVWDQQNEVAPPGDVLDVPADFEAAQSRLSFQSSSPDMGWVDAPNDQLISIRSYSKDINSFHKKHSDFRSCSGIKFPSGTPYENMNSRNNNLLSGAGAGVRNKAPLNDSTMPILQNSTQMIGIDETYAEIVESNTYLHP